MNRVNSCLNCKYRRVNLDTFCVSPLPEYLKKPSNQDLGSKGCPCWSPSGYTGMESTVGLFLKEETTKPRLSKDGILINPKL